MSSSNAPSAVDLHEAQVTAEAVPWLAQWGISACGIRPVAAHGGIDFQVGPARLSVVMTGSCHVLETGQPSELRTGDGLYTPAGGAHALLAAAGAWVVWVTWSNAPRTAGKRMPVANWQALVAAFHGLWDAHQRRDEASLPVWTALVARSVRSAVTPLDPRLHHVMTAIARQPEAPWNLEQLAHVAELGAEQLRRLCHDHIGMSPMEWVAHQRLYGAVTGLTQPRSLADIATQVGYGNQFNFSTAFKRVFGLSPAHWRQRVASGSSQPAKAGSGRWRRLG